MDYKRKVEFIDGNKVKVEVEITIENGRFSMSGNYGNQSFGQIVDEIVPANEYQQRLIDIWKRWHLNYLHAGTLEQEEKLKEYFGTTNIDYNTAVKFLKEINLFNDNGYEYGSGWIMEPLPENIADELEDIINNILSERNDKPLVELYPDYDELYKIIDKTGLFEEDIIPIIMLLCEIEMLTYDDLKEIKVDGDLYTIYEKRYLAGDEDTIEYYIDEELNNYLDEYVYSEIPERYHIYFDEDKWKEDARKDGYGHILNHYNGKEYYINYNGKYYMAYDY